LATKIINAFAVSGADTLALQRQKPKQKITRHISKKTTTEETTPENAPQQTAFQPHNNRMTV
jgi:hypothetical protein